MEHGGFVGLQRGLLHRPSPKTDRRAIVGLFDDGISRAACGNMFFGFVCVFLHRESRVRNRFFADIPCGRIGWVFSLLWWIEYNWVNGLKAVSYFATSPVGK